MGRRTRHRRSVAQAIPWRLFAAVVLVALLGGFACLLVDDEAEERKALRERLETRAELATVVVRNFVTDLAERERNQAERLLAAPTVDSSAFDQVVRSFEVPAAVLDPPSGA